MDFRDNQAVYLQIVDVICERILQKIWNPGEKLGSIREMAIELQVTPNTIQRSYDYLQQFQIIATQRGVGLFVESDAVKRIIRYKKEQFIMKDLPLMFKAMDLLGMSLNEISEYYKNQQKTAIKK